MAGFREIIITPGPLRGSPPLPMAQQFGIGLSVETPAGWGFIIEKPLATLASYKLSSLTA